MSGETWWHRLSSLCEKFMIYAELTTGQRPVPLEFFGFAWHFDIFVRGWGKGARAFALGPVSPKKILI